MKFEIFEQHTNPLGGVQYEWRLRARNGRVIANSAEGYKTRRHAEKMISRIQEACSGDASLQVVNLDHEGAVIK